MIASSGEGYKSKDSAKNGIAPVKKNAASATIEDKTQSAPPLKHQNRDSSTQARQVIKVYPRITD